MPKSSIEKLPPEVFAAYLRAVNDGFEVRQIAAHLSELGAKVSKSAVGRDIIKRKAALERVRKGREMAIALGKQLKDLPEEDHERATQELIHATLLEAATLRAGSEEAPDVDDVLKMSIAQDKLAGAKKKNVETFGMRMKLRKLFADEAAAAAERVGKEKGLSADVIDAFKSELLGLGKKAS